MVITYIHVHVHVCTIYVFQKSDWLFLFDIEYENVPCSGSGVWDWYGNGPQEDMQMGAIVWEWATKRYTNENNMGMDHERVWEWAS